MIDKHYKFLYDISKSLHQQQLDIDKTLQVLVSGTGKAMNVEQGCLITFEDYKTVENVYIIGAADTPQNRNREMWDKLLKHGLVGYVYHSDRIVVVRNIQTDPRWPVLPEAPIVPSTGSAVGLPLGRGKQIYGVLMFFHATVDYFNKQQQEFLKEVASVASASIANARDLRAARTNDTRYQSVFEHAPVPIILTDRDGTIDDANQQASSYLGFSRKVLIGLPIHDINNFSIKDLDLGSLSVGEEKSFRTNIYDIDGNGIPTLIRIRHLRLDGRNVLEWLLQDISVQIELEDLRRDLTSMVYHDLRGPLSSMHVAVHKLADLLQKHENPAVLKMLQLGLRGTQRMQRMIDSLLDIQRMEEGNTILNRQPAEMHPVLLDALQLVQPLAHEANQTLEMDISRIPITMLDIDMITRVVINLVENAVKYTPDGGKIYLSALEKEGVITISIRDTGPGIPETMLRQVFDKFSRVNHVGAPKGVGLGLAFCRLAIEAHNGKIWVESDGKSGSTFKFTLPIIEPPKPETESKAGNESETQEMAASA
jgi:two-component system, NtrC family, sensor histidine kinase KinB